jgi:hypothetical protein
MDSLFNGMGGSEQYRAEVFPELFPHQELMKIGNWSELDREMYCGGSYAKGYK